MAKKKSRNFFSVLGGGGGGYSTKFCTERHGNKNKTSTFPRLFHKHGMHLLALLSLYPRIWQISLPFYILQLVKSLPFHIPEAWKRYLVRPEPPRIVKPLIVSNSPSPVTKLLFPELRLNIIIIINLYFGLNWAHVIVGFHITSIKFKLKNYRFYRDFTFTVH